MSHIKNDIDIYQSNRTNQNFSSDSSAFLLQQQQQNLNNNSFKIPKKAAKQIQGHGSYFYNDLSFYMNKNATHLGRLGQKQSQYDPYYDSNHHFKNKRKSL